MKSLKRALHFCKALFSLIYYDVNKKQLSYFLLLHCNYAMKYFKLNNKL